MCQSSPIVHVSSRAVFVDITLDSRDHSSSAAYLLSTGERARGLHIVTGARRVAFALATCSLAMPLSKHKLLGALSKGLLLCTGVLAVRLSVCADAWWRGSFWCAGC